MKSPIESREALWGLFSPLLLGDKEDIYITVDLNFVFFLIINLILKWKYIYAIAFYYFLFFALRFLFQLLSTTADFIEERDTSFIIADEVTLLQNSNIGNSIQFKNFKFKYSENSFGVDAGNLGLNYKESDTNILYQLFCLL